MISDAVFRVPHTPPAARWCVGVGVAVWRGGGGGGGQYTALKVPAARVKVTRALDGPGTLSPSTRVNRRNIRRRVQDYCRRRRRRRRRCTAVAVVVVGCGDGAASAAAVPASVTEDDGRRDARVREPGI